MIKEILDKWRKRANDSQVEAIRSQVQVEEINGRLWITVAGYGVLKMQGDLDDCMYMLGKYRDLAVLAYNDRKAKR